MLKVFYFAKLTFIMFLATLFLPISSLGQSKKPHAEIGVHMGIPTMFVDGKPTAAMTYMAGRSNEEKFFKDFGKAGVKFVSFGVSPTSQRVWKGPDEFDFSSMDEAMNRVVKNNPDVLIFPRVGLYSPPWWNEQNPDELMRFHDGDRMKSMSRYGNMELPSWASENWRKDVANCLRRMIEHIESQPYGERVVGYHIASGGTSEWYYYSNFVWFFHEPLEYYLDYSRPQTEAFRRWLTEKYRSNESLQAAWHDTTVTLRTAEIASKSDKETTDQFVFFDPAKSQNTIDTYDFEAELIVDTIEYFCRVVKDATDRKAFTGAF